MFNSVKKKIGLTVTVGLCLIVLVQCSSDSGIIPTAPVPPAPVDTFDPVGGVPEGLPAFPGAYGFGSTTPGGRGGQVVAVTNLNDSGPGSFREAVSIAGPRTIIFRTGGTIQLQSPIFIDEPFLTIAGQTAPGDGILFRDSEIRIRTHDVILRGIRVRVGDVNQDQDWDGLALEATPASNVFNVVVDHCSVSWGIDENISTNGTRGEVRDITFSWNITSEALFDSHHEKGPHSKGMLLSKNNTTLVTVHHNLFIHNDDRNPKIALDVNVELINNVLYNYRSGSRMDPGSQANIIGNFYKPGPNTLIGLDGLISKGVVMQPVDGFPDMHAYVQDNIGPGRPTNSGDDWLMVRGSEIYRSLDPRVLSSGVPVDPVDEVMDLVMNGAGATIPSRDAVDLRLIDEMIAGEGSVIDSQSEVGGWPVLDPGVAPIDSDSDGIPDDWEQEFGLDPADALDANSDPDGDGYTYIEDYINSFF